MKRTWKALLLLSVMSVQWESAFALLELPSSLNTSIGYEGGTLAPANTGSSFFQNLLKKINFGGSFGNTPTQNTQTSQYNTTTQNQNTTNTGNTFSPGTVQTSSYDEEYQKILKQNLGGLPSIATTSTTKNGSVDINIATPNSATAQNQIYLSQDEIAKKFEKFILDVNKARSGYVATSTQVASSQQNISVPQQTNNMTPQQQADIMSLINKNTLQTKGTMCDFASTQYEKQQCAQQLRISCQRSYLNGGDFFEDCSQLPATTYAGLKYGSQPTYTLDNYLNHDNYYTNTAKTINVTQGSFPGQYFNKEGNYVGPDRFITGKATHYACNKKNGQYSIDTNLITTYKHITAYGIKAMWSVAAGDDRNACNFNYCGVAVPQRFVTSTYGSVAAGKNQLVQITNMNNLKCTVAPIQDFSATQDRWLHPGSNAIIDLSLCVMERLGGYGKIDVQYKPLKKGEVGCNQSQNK